MHQKEKDRSKNFLCKQAFTLERVQAAKQNYWEPLGKLHYSKNKAPKLSWRLEPEKDKISYSEKKHILFYFCVLFSPGIFPFHNIFDHWNDLIETRSNF